MTNERMDPAINKRWCEALESGEYEQGKDCLYRSKPKTYCCLGVLCDLYVRDGHGKWLDPGSGQMELLHAGAVLPPEVQTWAGLDNCSPRLEISRKAGAIRKQDMTVLNDETGMDFEQIAALIRDQL